MKAAHRHIVLVLVALIWLRPAGAAQAASARGVLMAQRSAAGGHTTLSGPLTRIVSLDLHDVLLGDALKAIDRQADLKIVYTARVVDLNRKVTLKVERVPAGEALERLLAGTEAIAVETPGGAVVLTKRTASQREAPLPGAIRGRVTNAKTGIGVPGAEVFLEKTSRHTQTDTAGQYRLTDIAPGTYMLIVRRLGYLKFSQSITFADREDSLNVALQPAAVMLDSLVSTATGVQQRRSVANAITTIDVDSVMKNAPVENVSDLLATRVPGLTAQHTSGAPGDPTRLRIRGIHSILRSNDPVIIVDGIKIYSPQSEVRSGNLTNLVPTTGPGGTGAPTAEVVTPTSVPAPSPLDQIDPNSIEKIEVVKGAAAATIYGADAANGVILITTKHGRAGPTVWDAHFTHSRRTTPGTYPTAYFSWGHDTLTGVPQFCTLAAQSCVRDSLVQFQALNDPTLTPLLQGYSNNISIGASGGVRALTYSLTGTYGSTISPLTLPAFEVARFRTLFNRDAPDWMKRPLRLDEWSVTSNMRAQFTSTGTVALTAQVSRQEQLKSTLADQLATLAGTYVDTLNRLYYRPSPPQFDGTQSYVLDPTSALLDGYYTKTTASYIKFTTGLNVDWQPRSWLTTHADLGVDVQPRHDEAFLEAGLLRSNDSGHVAVGTGRSVNGTFNLYGTATQRLGLGFSLRATAGTNLTTTTTNDLVTNAAGLIPGTRSILGAGRLSGYEAGSNTSSFGWFLESDLTSQRFTLSTGLRLDGGSSYGTRLSGSGSNGLGGLLKLPKIGGTWVVSEEPWFPFQGIFQSLKLFGSYGQAQTQPGPTNRLRLYTGSVSLDSAALVIATLGNTDLRPERSVALEGGFEGQLLDSRVSAQLALHHTKDIDKILPRTLPGSVDGGTTVYQNIGDVLNTGIELDLAVSPIRRTSLQWSVNVRYTKEDNKLVKLGTGVTPDPASGIVEGYPLFSRWARPILGYGDQNGDGVLEYSEVQLGDSLVFLGRTLPQYTTAFGTNLQLFGGAVGIAGDFTYISGATQVDATARTNWVLARPLFDPTTSFADQAAVLASTKGPHPSDYGLVRDVNTFRFNSLSVSYRVPVTVAKLLRAQSLRLAIQGENLAMHSTYNGRDPDVTAWSPGEQITDTGQLPLPRVWQIRVDASY